MHDLERSPILGLHPSHQHGFELFSIELGEQTPEGPLAGHLILTRTAPARAAASPPERGRERQEIVLTLNGCNPLLHGSSAVLLLD